MSAARKKEFKKALTAEDGRRKRSDYQVQLRKNKRMESLRKRRMTARSDTDSAAAGGLTALATQASAESDTVSVKLLSQYVVACNSEDVERQFQGTRQIRRLLSRERDPPVKAVIDSGVLPRMVTFLARADKPRLQFEATWALTNVASTDYTATVVDLNIVPHLVQLLRSQDADVREQSLWCLGNIAGDSTSYRDMILRTPDALNNLLLNIQYAPSLSLARNATWTLSNFCRGKPQVALPLIQPACAVLGKLMTHTDTEVLTDACWALSYISDGANERIQAVLDAGCIQGVVALMQHPKTAVSTPALRCVGNCVSGTDPQTQQVLAAGALPVLVKLMGSSVRNLRKEACWTMSNIAAGTPEQMTALIQTEGFIQALMNNITQGEWSVRKEATWALSNLITTGPDSITDGFVQCGAIEALCDLLKYSDPKILTVALDTLTAILSVAERAGHTRYAEKVEECEGLDAVEALQDHEDEEIYEKVAAMIQRFFAEEDEEEEDDGMTADNGMASFGAPGGDVSLGTNPFGNLMLTA